MQKDTVVLIQLLYRDIVRFYYISGVASGFLFLLLHVLVTVSSNVQRQE